MGYTTEFTGHLTFDKPLTAEQIKYIHDFKGSRRMARDTNKLQAKYKGAHGLNGDYGIQGEFFACPGSNFGQDRDETVLDFNTPPGQVEYAGLATFNEVFADNEKRIKEGNCQPSLWCQWTVSDDGERLEWDVARSFTHTLNGCNI